MRRSGVRSPSAPPPRETALARAQELHLSSSVAALLLAAAGCGSPPESRRPEAGAGVTMRSAPAALEAGAAPTPTAASAAPVLLALQEELDRNVRELGKTGESAPY